MQNKRMWAIVIASALFVSLLLVNYPVTACFGQTTECEGVSCYQGDGGATRYWYKDLFPPSHTISPGASTEWIINVRGGGGCSNYEHATITDNTPPSGWTTEIEMSTIYTGSFTYIIGGGAVNPGDDIEGKEMYIGSSWNFDVIYRITSPVSAPGGSNANMTCTVYVKGFVPENQDDYVYVHCEAIILAINAPEVTVKYPNGGEIYSGPGAISWDFASPLGLPLTFDVLLSLDSGVTYPDTLFTGLDETQTKITFDTTVYPDGFTYRIMVVAFDGTNYGRDTSDNDFTLDNQGPDPPTSLKIHFGLTSSGEPTSKDPLDDTGSDLERIQKDDYRAYNVWKGRTLYMDSFNVDTQTDPVDSADLHVKYWVENTQYTGTQSVMWKLDSDLTANSTGITPLNTEMMPVVKSFDLFAAGVDTIDKIANLDIIFFNDDGGSGQNVSFEYIWVTFRASSNDLGLTWLPSTTVDIDHYHVYRSTDDITYTMFSSTPYTYFNDPMTGVDLNNYFYKVYAVDIGGTEGVPTYTVGKYVTSVSTGWNLVSSPLEPIDDNAVTDVLVSLEQNYSAVQEYQAGESRPWHHWQESKPVSLNSLVTMDHTHSYYTNMKVPDDLKTIGRLHSTVNIPMKTGWNLIGYPRLDAQQWDTALSSINTKYDAVFRYDTGTGREVVVTGTDNMECGNGYWIHCTEDCILIL